MNNLENILKKYNLHPKSYQINGKCLIIDTFNGKYVIKKNSNNYDIYNYLSTRGFNHYPPNYNLKGENYDISAYINDIELPLDQKLFDLITLLSILHKKTSFKESLDLDEIKSIYENLKNNNLDLINYYTELNDYLDSLIFLSPAAYLLIRNISLIYYLLNFANKSIDEWYKLVNEKKTKRVALIHNNVSLNHLLINEHKYLISWDKSKIDEPINDLISLYKKYYHDLELNDLLNVYNKHNLLDKDEELLLLIYLALPDKIIFTNNNLGDVKEINEKIIYLRKVYEYIKNNQSKT